MKAEERLRRFLTTHYSWIETVEGLKDKELLRETYGEEVWKKATLERMCQELHQIIHDEGKVGLMIVVRFFMSLAHVDGADELFKVFGRTEEHSY